MRETDGLRYCRGIVSRLSICVCVLLVEYLCVQSLSCSGEPRQAADAFHRRWTLTTSRCWRPESDDQTKYFHFGKDPTMCVLTNRLFGRGRPPPPNPLPGWRTPCLTHTCHRAAVPVQEFHWYSREFSFFSTQFSLLSSLFIWCNECWPLWPPTEWYLQGDHFRILRHWAADHHLWTPHQTSCYIKAI